MARSINEWFSDHADASLGDSQDDEVVERTAPWDVSAAGMTTTRAGRRAFGSSSGRSGKGRGSVGAVGGGRSAGSGKTTKKQQNPRKIPQPRSGATPVESQIRRAAAAHPGTGYKQLARLLRAEGLNVSRAEVARVLAHPNSAWKRKAALPEPRKPAVVVPGTTQRSIVVPVSELCPSCGMRPTLLGICRCS